MKEKLNQDNTRLFREVEAIVDRVMARAKAKYVPMGYKFIDLSNRSGFDMSGYAYYFLQLELQRDKADGEFVVRSAVQIDYTEPLSWDTSRVLSVSASTDTFQVGSQSSPAIIRRVTIAAEELDDERLEEAVDGCMSPVAQQLMEQPKGEP